MQIRSRVGVVSRWALPTSQTARTPAGKGTEESPARITGFAARSAHRVAIRAILRSGFISTPPKDAPSPGARAISYDIARGRPGLPNDISGGPLGKRAGRLFGVCRDVTGP